MEVRNPEFAETVMRDPRFVVDEASLVAIAQHALRLTWARDPFDRLLCAHSAARRVPFCTTDEAILGHHPLLAPQLAPSK